MPRTKAFAVTGTAELNAMIERVTPDILGLLADGAPRKRAAIVGALAGRHDAEDVTLALIRLAVTGRVEERAGSTRWRRPTKAEPGSDEPQAGEADGGDQPGRRQGAPEVRGERPRFGLVVPRHGVHTPTSGEAEHLEPVMDLVGGFYLVRVLGIDRAPTELLGRPA